MTEMFEDPVKVAVAGDWHGNKSWAVAAIGQAHMLNADVILHVGDFGYWPGERGKPYFATLQDKLEKYDLQLYWLDGNHENHDHLAEMTQGSLELTTMGKYDRLHYMPRGFRWEWWGKTFMAVGGAVSVDKEWRTEGRDWWPAEILTEDQITYACREPKVDVILAHDCPHGVDIPGIGPKTKQRPNENSWPPHVLAEAEAHRKQMRRIWEAHQPRLWVHGHYHRFYESWLRSSKFLGLDCDGSTMAKNLTFLTREDMK